jgi:NAD(P)H dehydrogenase (quinone)
MITITGASGQLGRLVIEELLKNKTDEPIVAAVRTPSKVRDLVERGVEAREADYDRPETLDSAFAGTDKLLLISSSTVGSRFPQHKAVIDAAGKAGVSLLAYTSILHADTSPLELRQEHILTEQAIRESGVPYTLLRNGWYTENYTAGIPSALENGALAGCAGTGRIASAARADYAAAAAAVLTGAGHEGKTYELAGDDAYTLEDLAAEISRQSGKTIPYNDMTEDAYRKLLVDAGLPEPLAAMLADSDTGASKGGLFDDSRILSGLIGRPTTTLAEMVKRALAA